MAPHEPEEADEPIHAGAARDPTRRRGVPQDPGKNDALDVERRLAMHIKAITNVLVETNVCDAEDIQQALRTVEADVAILTALDPEIQAADAELDAIMRQFREG